MAEERGDSGPDVRGANLKATVARVSRLQRRLKALELGRGQPETMSVLKLLTTEEIKRAVALAERGGVLPNGEVLYPEAFREATPGEWEALEHWRKLCGEPLDHLELAEELLDRMGEAHGWGSREAEHAALLLKRLELPDESSWFVGKMAEAVLDLYAQLEVHPGDPQHPNVRGVVRRLERLKELDRVAPEHRAPSEGNEADEMLEAPQELRGPSEKAAEELDRAELQSGTGGLQEVTVGGRAEGRAPWYKRWFG